MTRQKKINEEKIIFFGRNKDFNITLLCYKELLRFIKKNDNLKLILTIISDDHHKEKGTLEALAKDSKLPFTFVKNNNVNNPEFVEKIKKLKPTIIITVQFPAIYKNELINTCSKACINLHKGWPLRGGATDERAIFYCFKKYYIIFHHITKGIDSGEIIFKSGFPISKNENGYTLSSKADKTGLKLFKKKFLPALKKGEIKKGKKQNLRKTFYAQKGSLENIINPNTLSAKEAERLVRAFNHPRKKHAYLKVNNKKFYIVPPTEIVSKIKIKKTFNKNIFISQNNKVILRTKKGMLLIKKGYFEGNFITDAFKAITKAI